MFGTQVTLAGADPNGLSHIATSYAATDLMNLSVGFGNRAMSRSLTYACWRRPTAIKKSRLSEPTSIALAFLGALGMTGYSWRRRRAGNFLAATTFRACLGLSVDNQS